MVVDIRDRGVREHSQSVVGPVVVGGDTDSYAIGTLDLFPRRRLEEIAGEVENRDGAQVLPVGV